MSSAVRDTMTSVDVDEIADRLYGLPPEEFTAARDDVAKQAADADARKAVKALRKPTGAAHEVNRLTREHRGDIEALVALGDDMRAAMGGDPQQVRRLTEQRRNLIGGLVDRDLPAAVQQDVTATLEAATADPDLGAAVLSGRLVKPLKYAGFGAMPDLDDAVATPLRRVGGVKRTPSKKTPTTSKPAAESAEKHPAKKTAAKTASPKETSPPKPDPRLTEARQRVLDLAGAADDAQRRYEVAARNAVETRKILEQAEKERADAHKAARAAHAEAEKARRELGRLERS